MLRFQVDGMSCGHCVQAVTQAVKAADPNAAVNVDLAQKRVEVGSVLGQASIADAIRQAGYEAVSA